MLGYMITDQNDNFVDTDAFFKEGQGKGQIAKWSFFYTQGYLEGSKIYGSIERCQKVVDYLTRMNARLGQNFIFKITGIDTDTMTWCESSQWIDLEVNKYHKISLPERRTYGQKIAN